MRDRWDLADGDEPLFVYRFANENDFAATLHEGGIVVVAQDDDDQDDSNDDDSSNIDEDPDEPPLSSLETSEPHREIVGVIPPEHPV